MTLDDFIRVFVVPAIIGYVVGFAVAWMLSR